MRVQNNPLMRTQTLFFLAGAALLTGPVCAQLPRIVLEGTGGPVVHNDLSTALTAAQAGDKLFLSGGTFLVAGPLVFDKRLHLIGAGIHPDSSGVTGTTTIATSGQSTSYITITTAASGSSYTGIVFSPASSSNMTYGTSAADDDPTGLVFQRCEFKRSINLGFAEGASSSSTFDECVFRGASNLSLNGRGGQAVFTRCIFDGGAITIFRPSGLFMRNCVVFNTRLTNSDNAIVQNCVFTYNGAPLWQVGGINISNCMIAGATMFSNSGTNTETNTIYGVAPGSMFVNETSNSYQFSDDLHLAPGSGGIGAGNDGNDIGLYGTHSPYKTGVVPYNPHFQQADIAPATDWNGALPVTIRTAAQSH